MRPNFMKGNYGVFIHYLTKSTVTAEEWNERTAAFDAETLAKQLHDIGAKWIFLTLGQTSGHFPAPNATYDSIAKVTPSKCSKRDIVSDLYDALEPYGIRLCLYMPSEGCNCPNFEWKYGRNKETGEYTGLRLKEFQIKWESVIREWSLRWGKKISAWWVDSCYFADQMYNFDDAPNFHSFAAALRAGNEDALLAFNPGVLLPVESITDEDDYTAGELSTFLPTGFDRFPIEIKLKTGNVPVQKLENIQFQLLCSLGRDWGHLSTNKEPRFPDALPAAYTRYILDMGGAMTWEVPCKYDGTIYEPFIRQLSLVKQEMQK